MHDLPRPCSQASLDHIPASPMSASPGRGPGGHDRAPHESAKCTFLYAYARTCMHEVHRLRQYGSPLRKHGSVAQEECMNLSMQQYPYPVEPSDALDLSSDANG